jgi:hypothetical protein
MLFMKYHDVRSKKKVPRGDDARTRPQRQREGQKKKEKNDPVTEVIMACTVAAGPGGGRLHVRSSLPTQAAQSKATVCVPAGRTCRGDADLDRDGRERRRSHALASAVGGRSGRASDDGGDGNSLAGVVRMVDHRARDVVAKPKRWREIILLFRSPFSRMVRVEGPRPRMIASSREQRLNLVGRGTSALVWSQWVQLLLYV